MPEFSFYPVAIVIFIPDTLLSDSHFYILLLGILSIGPNFTLILLRSIAAYSNLDTAYTIPSVHAFVVMLGFVIHLDICMDMYTSTALYDSAILLDISLELYPSLISPTCLIALSR